MYGINEDKKIIYLSTMYKDEFNNKLEDCEIVVFPIDKYDEIVILSDLKFDTKKNLEPVCIDNKEYYIVMWSNLFVEYIDFNCEFEMVKEQMQFMEYVKDTCGLKDKKEK